MNFKKDQEHHHSLKNSKTNICTLQDSQYFGKIFLNIDLSLVFVKLCNLKKNVTKKR